MDPSTVKIVDNILFFNGINKNLSELAVRGSVKHSFIRNMFDVYKILVFV